MFNTSSVLACQQNANEHQTQSTASDDGTGVISIWSQEQDQVIKIHEYLQLFTHVNIYTKLILAWAVSPV